MSAAPRALLDATVLDVDGAPVRLASTWAERPVVLVLLRHFGCLFCKEQAAEMSAIGDAIAGLGAGLVFVGSGSAQYAKWFQEDYAPRWPVYSDAELVTYRALEARRGFVSSVNPRTIWLGARAILRGFRQGGTQGDQLQQGAVCIVTPNGSMPYLHISEVAGDHPRPAEVLAVLGSLRTAAR
ncbi:MAG: peroxiredoxin-like family protein [Dehalococcoidia bacterium]